MKVPKKHGLDRKFKPWRKGKSSNSNKRTSLKQQLRGHERLLTKLLNDRGENIPGKEQEEQIKQDDQKVDQRGEKIQELQSKIVALKEEISDKQQSLVEKKHAEKAHGQRFLDRQRLVRREKKVRKNIQQRNANTENAAVDKEELLKLALDQVYVAHHPNDIKYMPLFKQGNRVIDQSRQLYRRAVTRKRILKDLATELSSSKTKVNWIGIDQYKRVPLDWSIQDEERVFGGCISRSSNKNKTKGTNKTEEDTRFAVASHHEVLLKAVDQAESNLIQEGEKLQSMQADDGGKKIKRIKKDDSSSDNSTSSSSDDSESDDDLLEETHIKDHSHNKSSSSVDSSSSSDSDSSSNDDETITLPGSKQNVSTETYHNKKKKDDIKVDHDDDDFLVDATDDHPFKKPAATIPALSTVRGDKSRGFETQSQRPGEYKKKRTRRY